MYSYTTGNVNNNSLLNKSEKKKIFAQKFFGSMTWIAKRPLGHRVAYPIINKNFSQTKLKVITKTYINNILNYSSILILIKFGYATR